MRLPVVPRAMLAGMSERHPPPKTFSPSELLTLDDVHRAARGRVRKGGLERSAYDYYRSGADQERTLRRNRKAFSSWEIWYRVLADVAERDLTTTVLGSTLRGPILVAPTAYHRLAHPDGELASARAIAEAGSLMVVSTLATTKLEDVAQASDGPKWFQLYVHTDRGLTEELIQRADAAGYRALVLTVDTPLLGRRLRDERNGFALPDGLTMENLVSSPAFAQGGSELAKYVSSRHDASLSWKDLGWIRERTRLPLVLKGIVRPDDAVRAADEGVEGIIVSNHGARQLDGAPATLDALPGVADAVGDRLTVMMDGGIRWGTDVLKAVALGAKAVLIGRPVLWGLAAGGEAGVARVLEILHDELDRAMALSGSRNLAALDRDLVRPRLRPEGR